MIMPSDQEYKETKLIAQSKREINRDFKKLAEWINKEYKVKPLNIVYDIINEGTLPRLQIIFEFIKDKEIFQNKNKSNIRSKETAIEKKFKELMIDEKHQTKKLFILFSAFEEVALIDINESIENSSVENLKNEINNPCLWDISRCFAQTTFFLYTDKDVKECETNGLSEKWAKMYYNLLKANDEFDYYREDNFSVNFDSKENLDTNYQGSLFYYYR